MSTITRTGPYDDREPDFRRDPKFAALISRIMNRGTSALSTGDKVSIAEVARLKEVHHDPRARRHLNEVYNEIAKAHLEFCLRGPR